MNKVILPFRFLGNPVPLAILFFVFLSHGPLSLMNYHVVIGNDEIVAAVGGIEALPTTFVIDRDGRVAARHVGYVDRETFEKEIKRLL